MSESRITLAAKLGRINRAAVGAALALPSQF